MVKQSDAYTAALERKSTLRLARQRAAEQQREAVYAAQPRLSEIDRLLAAEGAQIALTALSGNTEDLAALRAKIDLLSAEKQKLLAAAHYTEPTAECTLCDDTGYVNGRLCSCVKNLARRFTLEQLSREMPLKDCRFDNFNLDYYPEEDADGNTPRKRMRQILKLCRDYVQTFDPSTSKNLLFMGSAGLGKTHLSMAIVSGVVEQGRDVIYGSAHNLLSTVEKEHFSAGNEDSYEAMLTCDLLVIDDLGTEFLSPFTQTVLYSLINSRLLSSLPTIINTNLTMHEIEERYTARLSSRLVGSYVAKRFFGKDIRQARALAGGKSL